MRQAVVDLIGPERFEWALVALGIGLPIVMILAMFVGMGLRLPFAAPPGDDDRNGTHERQRGPTEAAAEASESNAD